MNTYTARFVGRKKDAIGIFYEIATTVDGIDESDARLRLYDRFEHISRLKLERIKTGFKVWIRADSSGQFVSNAIEFLTREAAEEWARDLEMRWSAVREWMVLPIGSGPNSECPKQTAGCNPS